MRPLYPWVLLIGSALPALAWHCLAQEFDTVISTQNQKPYTIIDQITDPQERKAFLALYGERDSRERAKLAEFFLATYPQSWLLAQVYEMASKAFIDLENYDRALQHGRESLKLLPENPLLLVPLANVQVQRSFLTEAKLSAHDALEYLERFARPGSIAEQAWPDLKRQLKASSFFALARATISEALAAPPGQHRQESLRLSEESLAQARVLNPLDPEISYLMGLNYLLLGKVEPAASSFAAAYQSNGVMQSKALQQLRRVYESSKHSPQVTFDTFLENVSLKAQDFRLTSPSEVPARSPHPEVPLPYGRSSDYAGSVACQQCHADQHRAWEQTGMARMFRPYRPEHVIGDFVQENEFYAGDDVRIEGAKLEVVPGGERFLFARMFVERGHHYFQIKCSNGQWVRYPVDYTIGSKWQQAYATRLPNGQIHVFPVQYNALHKRWINFWKVIDTEGSERADVRSFERLSVVTSYQANCAVCHTSQLRNTKGRAFEANNLEFREPGVNCEMCHGPSSRHVSAMTAGRPYAKQPADPPVDFSRISSQEYVRICAQCHMQSALRQTGPHGELNYTGGEHKFFQRSESRPLGEFSRKAFYKDGRFRETTFIVESLLRSACFKKGQVNCGHCHAPHGENASSNSKSLKFVDQPDQMCLQCHSQYAGKVELHTRHPARSEASRCVSCHMPPIMNSLLFKARTHQIDDIPNVEMTLRFGQEDSPNACLLCHSDKDVKWTKQQLQAQVRNEPAH